MMTVRWAGKLCAFPDGNHPDEQYAGVLLDRVHEELGDVLGALSYFAEHASIDLQHVEQRARIKYALFSEWGMSGILVEERETSGEKQREKSGEKQRETPEEIDGDDR